MNLRNWLLCAIALSLPTVFIADTHSTIDPSDGSRIISVADSPFALRQPHSLIDFMNQIKWVEERNRLDEFTKGQQAIIEKRYSDDDPEIEEKIKSNDPNCIKSRSISLEMENFVVSYATDLVPNFIFDVNLNRELQVIVSSKETLTMSAIEKLFLTNNALNLDREPDCDDKVSRSSREWDEDIETIVNVAEPELCDLSPGELKTLASFLADRMDEDQSRQLALYYSSFYWRIKGDSKMALKCLRRYLHTDPDSNPAKFQLGTLYIRLGKYRKATKLLEDVADKVTSCGDCYAALGDSLTLERNFPAAISAYDEAYKADNTLELASTKAALLRCVSRVFEEMENQHINLLGTIQDVNDYRENLKRLRVLESQIEENRATADARLQSKFAYQHLTLGSIPHLHCRGITHWNGRSDQQRLFCHVDNWKEYNASLVAKYEQNVDSAYKKEYKQAEMFNAENGNIEGDTGNEMEEYLQKLAPFVGMRVDEPQLQPKYPLDRRPKKNFEYYDKSWPKTENCEQQVPLIKADSSELPAFFLSPSNKGFIISELLTKYLALDGKSDISPLPWSLPECVSNDINGEPIVGSVSKMESVRNIREGKETSSFERTRSLKSLLLGLVEPINDSESHIEVTNISIGDMGQRIANLIKYGIGPGWIAFNLAALFYRSLGMTKDAVKCLDAALSTNLYKDVAYVQLAQLLYSHSPDRNSNDAERLLMLAVKEAPSEPLIYYMLGFIYQARQMDAIAESFLWQSLDIDPEFSLAQELLFQIKCKRKLRTSSSKVPVRNWNGNPVCCWPSEQEIYCFNKRSYKPPAFAYVIAPLLKTAAELRQQRMNLLLKGIHVEEEEVADDSPVFPLDYTEKGKVYAHQRPNSINLENYQPYSISFSQNTEDSHINAQERSKEVETIKETTKLLDFESIIDRQEIIKYDVLIPEQTLPSPSHYLIEKGRSALNFINGQPLQEYCGHYEKDKKSKDQLASTYVSASAKGIRIEDYIAKSRSTKQKNTEILEPICPDTAPSDATRGLSHELDQLPAYKYHQKLKFYRPERGLIMAALQILGGDEKERIEDVAEVLAEAIRTKKQNKEEVHWSLTTAAALYWRVRGDAVNAIECLRHALHNSPPDMRDVPLISLANIYYQAGFLNSALIVGGKALETSPDSVVAIHFTLATVYDSMGNFRYALKFYYSTLALQSNFQVAKDRIKAIHCETGNTYF
ncbi:tetratricopeptide repeat domain-containing protein [Ditylenchus destructor]|uniref:Tetratricopeptide repeat domain-containing protein n=1 Tax=Ditylenchus destructor TaxID=166010 RepID=A0AAD4RA19_9BILA|nr:tetratricopeptide repeat domain-containing protein [Ditylenchus destructor]